MSSSRKVLFYLYETQFFWTYVPMSVGLSLSAMEFLRGPFDEKGFACSVLGLLVLFAQMRFISDLRSYPIKLSLEPDHPLSKGRMTTLELQQLIPTWFFAMALCAALLLQLTSIYAAALYLAMTSFLFLIYKEFYAARILRKIPFLYAVLRHGILVLTLSFALSNTQYEILFESEPLAFSLIFVCAFLCHELGKNIDPDAPPLRNTHFTRWGRARFIAAYAVISGLLIAFAWMIHLWTICAPIQAISCGLVCACAALRRPSPAFRRVAEQASLYALILQTWSLPLYLVIEEFL